MRYSDDLIKEWEERYLPHFESDMRADRDPKDLAELDDALDELAKLNARLEAEKSRPEERWRRATRVAIWVSVIAAFVGALAAIAPPKDDVPVTRTTPEIATPIDWTDQWEVPPASPGTTETADEITQRAKKLFRDYRKSLNNNAEEIGDLATVPHGQLVVVVGRVDWESWAFSAPEGDMGEACLLEPGGALRQIAKDGDRLLVTYFAPTGLQPAAGACVGGELFFERTA